MKLLGSKVIIAYVILLLLPLFLKGQGSLERSAQKSLHKHKWAQAYSQLKKALQKDTTNTTAHFLLANYFFAPQNPAYQIDSAYKHTIEALEDFKYAAVKERERMKRFSLDSIALVQLRKRIDSAAFEQAREINTEESYLKFLAEYPFALQRAEAESLRDEAAYREAVRKNTHQAFLDFVQKYPNAKRAGEAQAQYERLLYMARTSDQRLSSYEGFLKDHPNTPYRKEIERNIFEMSTASGTIEHFEAFLKKYPGTVGTNRAKNILYHLLLEEHREAHLPIFNTDSLENVARLARGYLIPFLRNDKFGFMDENGVEIIKAEAADIGDEYLCGNITEDVIVLSDKLVSRNGNVIWRGQIGGLDDLGYGFLKVENDQCIQVIHKTGFAIGEGCYADVRFLHGKLFVLKKNQEWLIYTLAGRKLQSIVCDDVSSIGDIVLFRQGDKYGISSVQEIVDIVVGKPHNVRSTYDEVKHWAGDYLLLRQGNRQGLVDQLLRVIIPLDEHKLSSTFFGYTSSTSQHVRLLDRKGQEIASFQKAEIQEPWVAVKADDSWRLFDALQKKYISAEYDSIRLFGAFAMGINPETVEVHVPASNSFTIKQPVKVEFLSGQDSTSYLVIHHPDDKKSVYDTRGQKLFTVAHDKVHYAGNGFFVVHKKEKKGLINSQGKSILPVEYDAIGSVNNGTISFLKSMKFGLYNYKLSKLIKHEYEKNIIPYNSTVLSAFKSGGYGFVDWSNKPLSKFEFSEVQYWNDSIALVKQNSAWAFFDLKTKKPGLSNIKKVKFIKDSPEEKLAIIQQDENFGVMSSKHGTIIPIRFSDLINVGSADHPTYFTEKHVEEASLFVVIYYNNKGQMLRREVYEQDDYEKIYCSD